MNVVVIATPVADCVAGSEIVTLLLEFTVTIVAPAGMLPPDIGNPTLVGKLQPAVSPALITVVEPAVVTPSVIAE
jgi:hypothetical protein